MLKVTEDHVGYDLDRSNDPFEKGWLMGEPETFQPFTEDRGKLFRAYQKQYGGCVGKVYQDTPDGEPDAIGWVFRKKDKYEDTGEFFWHEVWVTLGEVLA